MKRFLSLAAFLALALFCAGGAMAGTTFFSENFDLRTAGEEMVGKVAGWEFFKNASGVTYDGTSTVIDSKGVKSMLLTKTESGSEDYDMVLTPSFDFTPSNPGRELTRFSYRIKPSSDQDIFALYSVNDDGSAASRFFYLCVNVNEGTVRTTPGDLKIETVKKDGDWNSISFVLDTLNGKVVEFSCNGITNTCSLTPDTGYAAGIKARLRISTQYSSQKTITKSYIDDIKVESFSRCATPTVMVPESAWIKVTEEEGSLAIYNGGPDADITFNATSEASWLNISPASGTFKDAVTMRLIPKNDTPEDYYKTTVTINCGDYGTFNVPLTYQHGYLYKEDFEGFALGDILAQDSDWKAIYSGQGTGEISDYKVIGSGFGGGKCVNINQISSYGGTHTTFHNTENLSSRYDLKMSFKVKFNGSPANEYFGNADGNGTGELNCNDRDGRLKLKFNNAGNGSGWEFPVDADYSDWVDISYTLNTAYDNCMLLEATVGGVTVTGINSRIKRDNPTIDAFTRLRLFAWSPHNYYVDDISLQAIPRSNTEPKITAPDSAAIGVTTNQTVFAIRNGGIGTINFTTKSNAGWLTVTPESGSYEESQDIVCKVADSAEHGYYTTTVEIDGGDAGKKYVTVACQNGFLYMENFDDLQVGKSILEQDASWTQAYGSQEDGTFIVRNGGFEGGNYLEYSASNYMATHVNLKNSEGLATKYNLKFTFWVKCLDWGSDLWCGNSAQSMGEFELHSNDSGTYIKTPAGIEVQNSGDLSDWTKVSYTINTMAGNERLLECTFGDGEALDLNALMKDTNQDRYDTFRVFVWGGDAKWGIDNLSIECVERASAGPELEALGGGIANLGTNSVKMTVYNLGQGTLEYTSEVTEGSGWLTISGAGEGGAYTGKIVDTGSKELTLNIDRTALGNAYGHAVVKTTSGDAVKYVHVYAQSGTKEGYTFYANDFESCSLGSIKDSDPVWENNVGDVIDDEGNKCLKFMLDGAQEYACRVPDKLYDQYNFRFSCKMKFPEDSGDYGTIVFGNEMDHTQGEYWLTFDDDGSFYFYKDDSGLSYDNITNVCQRGQWIDFSYTINSDPLNRKLISLTFGESTYEFEDQIIDATDYGWFKRLRIYNFGPDPWLIDDICMEAIPKSTEAPKMEVSASGLPVAFDKDEVVFTVKNAGGQYFDFKSEVVKGGEYLKAATNGTCFGTYQFKGKIDRSQMGVQFYRPVVRFTSTTAGVDPVDVTLAIQSGNDQDGVVLFESNFPDLIPTTEEGGVVKNELSSQDSCWVKNTDHNRIDIVADPAGSGKLVAKVVNANDWSKYLGYNLNLNVKSNVWDKFDLVYDMDIYIPDTFVERSGEEHPEALFYVSQDNSHRQCEFEFSLNSEDGNKPVKIEPQDISNTDWWSQKSPEMSPVANNSWFSFYFRMNGKLVDYDHKTLHSLTFGENEFQMEGADSTLTYPGGIEESVLLNEAMPMMKLWCYCDNAGICLDNVRMMLVPKGLPEPALMGLAALLLALLGRKRS